MTPDHAVTAAVGAELHRLVPAAHLAARPRIGPVVAPLRPHVGIVVDLRTLLLAGSAPLRAVRAIHRYQNGVDTALDELVSGGWLLVRDDAVLATDRCRALLDRVMAGLDDTCTDLWGTPTACLDAATAAITAATTPDGSTAPGSPSNGPPSNGASDGPAADGPAAFDRPAFDALAAAGHPGTGTTAGRLFTALSILRYHRADAHAAAWAAAGLTVDTVRALPEDDPLRLRIEAATNRDASAPYRTMADALLEALRALPG